MCLICIIHNNLDEVITELGTSIDEGLLMMLGRQRDFSTTQPEAVLFVSTADHSEIVKISLKIQKTTAYELIQHEDELEAGQRVTWHLKRG